MLERDRINFIVANKKSPMSFDDYPDFFLFIFPIAIIFIGSLMFLSSIRSPKGWSALAGSLVIVSLGSFLLFFVKKRLFERNDFEQVYLNDELSIEAIAQTVQDNFRIKELIINSELKIIMAYTKPTAFSWGEVLTIIVRDNIILINSRPAGQPITVLKDRKNVERIRQLFL